MRRALIAFSLLLSAVPTAARAVPTIMAGYGEVDSTWHVGAGSGQYTDKDSNVLRLVQGDTVDPHSHSWIQRHSYGVASRLSIRAIVVQGTDDRRVALVKADHYLASDALARRASQILDAAGTSGVGYEDILFMTTHNHSSPFYYSPSWGPWLFQDAFDLRAFEYEARNIARAIELAAADLRPAAMGATTVTHRTYKGNIAGPSIGDDGTPAGYPDSHADFGLSVLRFDSLDTGDPIAVFANFGQHPESHDGYDLITADYLGPLERMVERDTGAPLVWSQGDVGSAEGPYEQRSNSQAPRFELNDRLDDGVIRAWAHVGHAQTERGARYLADSIVAAWGEIGAGDPLVPMSSDFPVSATEAWVPPPLSHPYASVSNCRTETTVEGNPGSPILGLPDCAREGSTDRTNQTWEQLKAAGVPLPEHYDSPSWAAVQENQRLRLQVVRLGEVVLGSCSCEAQMDLILNFESRADDEPGVFDGYEYPCAPAGTGWTCPFGRTLEGSLTISDATHRRMLAQVHNDAVGWDAPGNAVTSNTEPADPDDIKGNFTKEELPPALGYALPIGVGHAAEYQGYVVSYREYMIRDHYRKALTAYGPHTADYMVTRMARLAGALKGGPPLAPELHQAYAEADEVREQAFMLALGRVSSAAYDAWVASLPNDLGPAEALEQPGDIALFDAATFTWRGGSNAVDNPVVRVERLDGGWAPFADQTGEVQTMVEFPQGPEALETYTGGEEWRWTANLEAFGAFPRTVVPGGHTPAGTYRFVVDGAIRTGGSTNPYHLESEPFEVGLWPGPITVSDARVEPDGSASFVVDPISYPRTYDSDFRYVHDDGNTVLCRTCAFRPWATTGEVKTATVRVVRSGGGIDEVLALRAGDRWVAPTALVSGDVASIEVGGVTDWFGGSNAVRVEF